MAAECTDFEESSPLHLPLYHCASSETILMLLDTYPKVAQMQDDYGNLPFHYLHFAYLSTSVVDKLLQAYPDAARVKNSNGQIPLHCACESRINKNALISIQSLISVYPEGIDVEDGYGNSPSDYLSSSINHGRHKSNKFLLHMAIRKNFSKNLVT